MTPPWLAGNVLGTIDGYDRCAPFANDLALEHGSDVTLSDLPNPDLTP